MSAVLAEATATNLESLAVLIRKGDVVVTKLVLGAIEQGDMPFLLHLEGFEARDEDDDTEEEPDDEAPAGLLGDLFICPQCQSANVVDAGRPSNCETEERLCLACNHSWLPLSHEQPRS